MLADQIVVQRSGWGRARHVGQILLILTGTRPVTLGEFITFTVGDTNLSNARHSAMPAAPGCCSLMASLTADACPAMPTVDGLEEELIGALVVVILRNTHVSQGPTDLLVSELDALHGRRQTGRSDDGPPGTCVDLELPTHNDGHHPVTNRGGSPIAQSCRGVGRQREKRPSGGVGPPGRSSIVAEVEENPATIALADW